MFMIESMARLIAKIETDGSLLLPPEMKTALGLRPGSELEVTLDDRHLTLQPLEPDPIEELCGYFGPGPSLEDDLKDWRSPEKW
jgi:bifunctional DNA-binding transcriptional regulator/antitoxin component of YhaV-PrlF toxin-antitoxin module